MKSISVVVPLYNEVENINIFFNELLKSLIINKNLTFEIILVNDGSSDETENYINNIISKNLNYDLKILSFEKNFGQSKALYEGIMKAKHSHIVTIDGDLQNDPNDIEKLLIEYNQKKACCLVSGIRINRKDTFVKRMSSKLANKIRSYYLNDDCVDTGCSLKVFSKDAFMQFPFFNGMHRFLPALFKGYGFSVFFVNVNHRYRIYGKSKYGISNRFFINIKNMIFVKKIIIKYNKIK